MTIGYELLSIAFGLVLNFIALAYNAGRVSERLKSLGDALLAQGQRFDADLGRLNAKVDNDVQGRRAVAQMQQQVTEVETTLRHVAERVDRVEELHIKRDAA